MHRRSVLLAFVGRVGERLVDNVVTPLVITVRLSNRTGTRSEHGRLGENSKRTGTHDDVVLLDDVLLDGAGKEPCFGATLLPVTHVVATEQ